ncbi:hypothetical protein WA026_021684 [Henosepilachna vigintioctopunctata]|uniref:STAG domain-containing protein n=1 Tax=Henosepilachna vigintioctopunctata TaxID=420089 RepID=A0AAW1UCE6_9CUCU
MSDLLEQNLCSPRKIRKVECVPQTIVDVGKIRESQESQKSCATSTPTKQNIRKNFDISLDLSSIHSVIAAPSERSFLTESFQDERESEDDVSTIHSKSDLSLSKETSSIYSSSSVSKQLSLLQKPNAKLFKGKLWKFFKPKTEGTLYFKIFTDFDGIQECTADLLSEFQINKWNAILSLMKFFIDVSGYQKFELQKYFNSDVDPNIFSEKVIKLMEFDLLDPELLEYKTYIFYESEKGKSKLSATLAAAIQKFLHLFFLGVHAISQLFSDVLYKYLFNFLYHMCQSILRPIRHTGLVLVRMILTIFNKIMEQLMINSDSEIIDEDLPSEKKIRYMERYLEFLFGLCAKNCLIPDSNLAIFRAENVLEMGTWIIDCPQLYFKKCFQLLPKLLIDEFEVVRLNTLNVFDSVLKTKSTHLYVTRYIKLIVEMVSDRLKDVSIKVVVAAVNIFSGLLDDYRHLIGAENICQISNLLYGASYSYAKAAGSFMSKYLASTYTDESQLLHNFVELSCNNTSTSVKMKPLFVEAFSEYETVLKNYPYLVNYLITSSENEATEFINNLMELIYYSVYQTLKGESVMKRKHSVQAPPLSSDQQIAEIFLLNIKSLFELFQTKLIALKYLIEILCLIEYDILTTSYHSQFVFMLKNCRQFFLKIDDDELLESICHLFKHICYDKNMTLKETMEGKLLNNLFHSMSEYLRGYLESEDQEISLESHFKKIAIMYESFNLNEYFEWNDLFLNWGKVLLSTGQITACKQFLISSIEEMTTEKNTSSDEFRTKILYFKKIFSDYTKSLSSVLISIETTNDLKYKAFISLCHLHNFCDRILLKVPEFDGVRFSIIEDLRNNFCGSLTQFFKKSIVYDRSLLLETRKKYVIYWLNLIFNGLIDILYVVPLFECYYICSQEYGSLIEWISDRVYANNPEMFFNIILTTLGDLAVELFVTKKKSVSSPEAVELMELASKFSNMAQFKHSSEEVLNFIRMALIFTFKEELLEFLILLKNFTSKFSTDEQQCLDILKELLPPEYENHNFVKAFRMKLKSKNIKDGKASISFMSYNSRSKGELEMSMEPKLKKRKRSFTSKNRSKTIKKKRVIKSTPEKVSKRKKQLPTYEDDEDTENSSLMLEKKKSDKNNKSTASAKNKK